MCIRDRPGGAEACVEAQPEIDGFHLVIEALKLNGIDTIFGLPGIPITDLTRKAQAAGMRVISFRHEQNAGYAASIAGFLTQTPGICLTVSAPPGRSATASDVVCLRASIVLCMGLSSVGRAVWRSPVGIAWGCGRRRTFPLAIGLKVCDIPRAVNRL